MFFSDGVIPFTRAGNSGVSRPVVAQSRPPAPFFAGTVIVNGEEQIVSGLYRVSNVFLTMSGSNISPDGESKLSWYQLDPTNEPGKFVIRVEKSGANDGILGDQPISVSWMAVGEA